MIFVLKDTQVQEWDRAVSSHILRDASGDADDSNHVQVRESAAPAQFTSGSGSSSGSTAGATVSSADVLDSSYKPWPLEKLQMYFHYCRQNNDPQMVRPCDVPVQQTAP
jgi:DNA replicative helicase MCM subunit Mcm2 (Cdc46/Mcm family)